MKNFLCLLFVSIIALTIASCANGSLTEEYYTLTDHLEPTETTILGNDYQEEERNIVVQNDNDPGFFLFPERREDDASEFVAQTWAARLESFLQADVTRMEYVFHPRGHEPAIFATEDLHLIERWQALLPQLNLAFYTYNGRMIGGTKTELVFFQENESQQLFYNFQGLSRMRIDASTAADHWSLWRNIRIDNIDDVREELVAILAEMGVYVRGNSISWRPF